MVTFAEIVRTMANGEPRVIGVFVVEPGVVTMDLDSPATQTVSVHLEDGEL